MEKIVFEGNQEQLQNVLNLISDFDENRLPKIKVVTKEDVSDIDKLGYLQDFLIAFKREIMQEVDRRITKQLPVQEIQEKWINKKEAKQLLGYSSDTSLQNLRDHHLIVFTYVYSRKILYSRSSILEYLKAKKGIDPG